MTTFDERERAFENKFAHDEELRFKAEAHRDKAIARWAAELMGKSETETEAYVQTIVSAFVGGETRDALVARLRHDFAAAGIVERDSDIEQAMDRFMAEAVLYTRQH